MTIASLLLYEGVTLMIAAIIAFAFGLGRVVRRRLGPNARLAARRRVLQRADLKCGGVLLVAALSFLALSRVSGMNPVFSEPSGNIGGGVILIIITTTAIVIGALAFRHVIVNDALRALETRDEL